MTKSDVLKMITILKAAYPHSFKDMGRDEAAAMVALWERVFRDDNPVEVGAAIDSLIATRTVGYSPTPGEIKEQLYKVKHVEDMDAAAAWALVSKACANGFYGYREEFAKLPDRVQRAVGAPEQLKAWAIMDSDTVESVVASNFMKAYRTVEQRDRELEKLPSSVKNVVSQISGSLGFEKKELAPHKPAEYTLEPLTSIKRLDGSPAPDFLKKAEYKPPDPEAWEKKREEAMRRIGEKGA